MFNFFCFIFVPLFNTMYISQKPRTIYTNPKQKVTIPPPPQFFGFEYVVEVLRRLKALGYITTADQEVVENRRVLTWKLGTHADNECVVIQYNLTFDDDWFTFSDCNCNAASNIDWDLMFDRGADIEGPNGNFTFDQESVVEMLLEIEERNY